MMYRVVKVGDGYACLLGEWGKCKLVIDNMDVLHAELLKVNPKYDKDRVH
jgi:hypothetical protein